MLKRRRRKYITVEVWVKDKEGNTIGRIPRKKIFLLSPTKGRMLDGREIEKVGEKWIYHAR